MNCNNKVQRNDSCTCICADDRIFLCISSDSNLLASFLIRNNSFWSRVYREQRPLHLGAGGSLVLGCCRKSASTHIAHNSKNVLHVCRLTVNWLRRGRGRHSLCVAGLRVAQDAMHQHACFVRHQRQDHHGGTVIYKHTIYCVLSHDVAQEVLMKTCP